MENANLIKGNKLEESVSLIERTIIESNPSLRASNFKIEPKKIIIDRGVRYEIDLYVEIDQGFGYKSIFIFECKNWEANVPTEEITKFSDKIRITNAQRGFFVAKSYTTSASAKAKQDERMDLLYVDDNLTDLSQLVRLEFINKINKILGIDMIEFGVTLDAKEFKRQVIDFEKCVVKYQEKEGKLKDFVNWLLERMAEEKMTSLINMTESKYTIPSEKEFDFQSGELWIMDQSFNKNIGKIKIKAEFDIELVRPKIVSKIDVITRGRVIEYEAVRTSTGGEIKFSFVAINK